MVRMVGPFHGPQLLASAPMTQPTAEAYDCPLCERTAVGIDHLFAEIADLVYESEQRAETAYDKGVAEGRRLERERLAPLVEAAKSWREFWRGQESGARPKFSASLLVAAVDALTRQD